MAITVAFARPDEGPKSGPVLVGWFLSADKGAVLFDAPERLIFRQTNKTHAKSASRHPAVMQMESRCFVIKCPYDLHIGFGRDEKGKAHLINRQGIASLLPVRSRRPRPPCSCGRGRTHPSPRQIDKADLLRCELRQPKLWPGQSRRSPAPRQTANPQSARVKDAPAVFPPG